VRARRAATSVVLLAIATLTATAFVTATPPSRPRTLEPEAFTAVALPPEARVGASPSPLALAPSVDPGPIPDFQAAERSFAPRATPRQRNTADVVVIPPPTPKPRPQTVAGSAGSAGSAGGGGSSGGGSRRVRGSASWYCQTGVSACHYQYPGGMYAAAGPALRIGDWRGRRVQVCANGNCVRVTLVDWCQCYGTRVIDLYSDAFRRLAPLSAGTTQVTVSW
jgi:rare lipoprotein A (peptidoglycan hydrolase)